MTCLVLFSTKSKFSLNDCIACHIAINILHTHTSPRARIPKVNLYYTFINLIVIFDIGHITKNYWYCWKEHLIFSNTARFESSIFWNSEDKICKTREIFTDICTVADNICPSSYKLLWNSQRFRNFIFVFSKDTSLKLGHFTIFKMQCRWTFVRCYISKFTITVVKLGIVFIQSSTKNYGWTIDLMFLHEVI